MSYYTPQRYDFRTRIQVPHGSSDAILLDYLKTDHRRMMSQKEMLLAPLRSYWMPIAHEALREIGGTISDDELARMAQNAILLLRERSEVLRVRFCPRFSDPLTLPNTAAPVENSAVPKRLPDGSRHHLQNDNRPYSGNQHRPC
jgi:hypothetical protein